MRRSKNKETKGYSDFCPTLSSPLAQGLCTAVGVKDPLNAILKCARLLVAQSGMRFPPFRPHVYANLRGVEEITYKDMEAEGRLIRKPSGFLIELRKDRSHARRNFTCAHEIGHTFFFEAVPSIKYRRLSAPHVTHDPDEEFLCNVAASELLMPSESLRKIARNYPSSPSSLQELSNLYETSIAAMAVRLATLNLWQTKIILWERNEGTTKARWIVEPGRPLKHFPSIEVENYERSSINRAFDIEETVKGEEWLCIRNRFVYCKMQSMRLTRGRVLSCTGFKAPKHLSARTRDALPTAYTCTCNGTGTRLFQVDGYTYAAACLADHGPVMQTQIILHH